MRREYRERFPRHRWSVIPTCITACAWRTWRGKRSRHSRRMHNPQFYVSGKRPIVVYLRQQASVRMHEKSQQRNCPGGHTVKSKGGIQSRIYTIYFHKLFHHVSIPYTEHKVDHYWACRFPNTQMCWATSRLSTGLHTSGQMRPQHAHWSSPKVPIVHYVSGIYDDYLCIHEPYGNLIWYLYMFCWINFVWVCLSLTKSQIFFLKMSSGYHDFLNYFPVAK